MDINLSISSAPSITTDYIVVAIYSASSPTVVADFQSFAAPHTSPRNIIFTGVDAGVYYVRTWQHSTGTVGGTLRHEFVYDPSYSTVEIRLSLFLHVGTTPGMVAGTTSYTATPADGTLDGWDYNIELRQSYGTLEPNVDWQKLVGPTGWELLLLDYTFQPDEVYILHFYPKITVVTPTVVTANLFSDCSIINTDTSLVAADMSKVYLLQSASAILNVTLPDITTVTALKIITFISDGGNQINASIKSFEGGNIQFKNGSRSSVILGQCERVTLFMNDGVWNVFNADGQFSQVGQIINQYNQSTLNSIFADGSLLVRAQYPRLWEYVQTLDATMLISDANWLNVALYNKSRYSTGDGSTTFRIPLLTTYSIMKGVDGSARKAASQELDALKDHQHQETIGTLPSSLFGRGGTYTLGKYAGTGVGNVDLTSHPTDTTGTAITVGPETLVKNTGVYLLILT